MGVLMCERARSGSGFERANPGRRRADRVLAPPVLYPKRERMEYQWLSAQPLRAVAQRQSHGISNLLIGKAKSGPSALMENQRSELDLPDFRAEGGYPRFSRARPHAVPDTVHNLDFRSFERKNANFQNPQFGVGGFA